MFLVLLKGSRRIVEEIGEKAQFVVPLGPFLFRHEKVIANVAEKLHFHDVNFLDSDPGHLGPCLVGVRIIVQDCSSVSFSLMPFSRKEKCIHLLPSMRAIVINRYSLPFFPRTPGLNFFNR